MIRYTRGSLTPQAAIADVVVSNFHLPEVRERFMLYGDDIMARAMHLERPEMTLEQIHTGIQTAREILRADAEYAKWQTSSGDLAHISEYLRDVSERLS